MVSQVCDIYIKRAQINSEFTGFPLSIARLVFSLYLPRGVNPSVLNSFDNSLKGNTKIDDDIDRCLLLQRFSLSNSPSK